MAVVTQGEYSAQIRALLPHGLAWSRDDVASVMGIMVECWAMEFQRADARIDALIREADPRFCVETFQEWLTQWGVPDECLALWGELLANKLTAQMLRQALVHKVTTVGGQTFRFFIELAESYGYRIRIEEYRPWRVTSTLMDLLIDNDNIHHTMLVSIYTGHSGKVYYFDTLSGVNDPLSWWGDKIVECLLRRYAPAHVDLRIGYLSE